MEASTRDQFIEAAQRLFADKGFYGVSIAAIAAPMGLTKQALLHHFGSKEKLYGEVLQRLSSRLMVSVDEITGSGHPPLARLNDLILAQYRLMRDDESAAKLVMRELLDNEQRADNAGNWYLRAYLDSLIDTLRAIVPRYSQGEALAVVYQFVGAAHYFAVSRPTLEHMYEGALFTATQACYEDELRRLVDSRLQRPA